MRAGCETWASHPPTAPRMVLYSALPCALLNLQVGERGFEPPTSRTRTMWRNTLRQRARTALQTVHAPTGLTHHARSRSPQRLPKSAPSRLCLPLCCDNNNYSNTSGLLLIPDDAPLDQAGQPLRHSDHQLLIRHPEPPERPRQPLIQIVADVVVAR